MGYFDFKELCTHCGKRVGLNRFKTAKGFLCADCFKKCGYHKKTPIATKTKRDIEYDFKKHMKHKEALSKLNSSRADFYIDKLSMS